MTIVLGVIAVVIGLQLQSTSSPDGSFVSGGGTSNDCTGKSCGAGTCFPGDNPNDGGYGCNCNDGTTLGPSLNPGTCGGGGGGQCAGALDSCENTSCCDGLVCQGTSGSRRCEDPGDEDQCPGGTCSGYISFSCSQLTNGQCLENPVDGNNPGHAGGCGQIDQVCVGGTRNRQLCGDFTIFNSSCGGGSNPPPTNPPPTNPPPTNPPPPQVSLSQCGEECSETTDCVNGHTCDGGICKLPTCLTPGNCSDNACNPIACGDGSVDSGETCGEPGLSCGVGEICITSSCICIPSICGDPCSADSQCPGDHSCSGGTCVLDECIDNPANCTSDQCDTLDLDCGDPCSSSDACPNDHTCSNGTCTLNICVTNPSSCSTDGCIHTPITAIISDDVDRVIAAIAMVILGGYLFASGQVDRLLGGVNLLLPNEIAFDKQSNREHRDRKRRGDLVEKIRD